MGKLVNAIIKKWFCRHEWEHLYKEYVEDCFGGDEELSDETYLMLIITEIAEAVNADRKDKYANAAMFKEWQGNNIPTSEETRTRRFKEDFEAYIKDTVEDELADTVIRCLDLAGLKEWSYPTLECINTASWQEEAFKVPFPQFACRLCQELLDKCGLPDVRVFNVIGQILVYCRFNCINLEWHIKQKMRYNELKNYKHGNKKH